MLTEKTLEKIVYEYQHGGVKSNHPELTTYERKALLKEIKNTDVELAEMQLQLMDTSVFCAKIGIGIVICIVTKKLLESYF